MIITVRLVVVCRFVIGFGFPKQRFFGFIAVGIFEEIAQKKALKREGDFASAERLREAEGEVRVLHPVAVVGGGDAAIEEALFLSRLARRVHIIHRRDQLRAVQILQERARAEGKISFIWNTVVEEIIGDARVSGLRLKNLKDGTASTLTVDGVFIYVGLRPNTGWLAGLMPLTDDGLIVTNDLMETTLPGVFAAGDVRKKLLRQITTAVGDGATAAFAAEKYVQTF